MSTRSFPHAFPPTPHLLMRPLFYLATGLVLGSLGTAALRRTARRLRTIRITVVPGPADPSAPPAVRQAHDDTHMPCGPTR